MATTTTNPIALPKSLSTKSFYITSTCTRLLFFHHRATTTSLPGTARCSSSSSSQDRELPSNSLKDALSGMVGNQVDELLNREENRVLLDGLEKASQRVEMAQRELAEIERQQLESRQLRNYIKQLEIRASEIAECQKEISAARAMVEAERSLLLNAADSDALDGGEDGEGNNKDAERWESIKAAVISALVGTLAALPISFSQVTSIDQLILPSVTTFFSCALFGVTFRYAVRRDLDNFQLKTGTSAAFGIVKGLAMLGGGPPLELSPGSLLSHAFDGALYVSESLLIFVFAAVSLDFCFKLGLLSPFPIKRSASN